MVVIGIRVTRVEINEAAHLVRMARSDRAQFLAGNRVTDQHRPREPQRVDHSQNVVSESICLIPRRWRAGSTVTAARDAVHVIVGRQLWSKLVKDVSIVSEPCQ